MWFKANCTTKGYNTGEIRAFLPLQLPLPTEKVPQSIFPLHNSRCVLWQMHVKSISPKWSVGLRCKCNATALIAKWYTTYRWHFIWICLPWSLRIDPLSGLARSEKHVLTSRLCSGVKLDLLYYTSSELVWIIVYMSLVYRGEVRLKTVYYLVNWFMSVESEEFYVDVCFNRGLSTPIIFII